MVNYCFKKLILTIKLKKGTLISFQLLKRVFSVEFDDVIPAYKRGQPVKIALEIHY